MLRSKLGLVVVGLVVVGGAGAFGVSRLLASTAPVEYRTATVARANVTQTVPISGSVSSSSVAQVSFKVSATITAVLASVGQAVAAGDVLARVDDTAQRSAAQQAEANLNAAQARYDLTVAGSDLASLRQQIDQAQQSVNRLQATYSGAKTNLQGFHDSAKADRDAAGATFTSAQTTLATLQADLAAATQWSDVRTATTTSNSIQAVFQQAQAQMPVLDQAFADLSTSIASLKAQVAAADAGRADPQAFAAAQVTFNAANARAQSAVDGFSAQMGSALASANGIIANLNTAGPTSDASLDRTRGDAGLLVQRLGTVQHQLISTKTRLAAISGPVTTLGDAVNGSALASAQNALASARLSLQTKLDSRTSDIQSALASLQSAQASYDNAKTALASTTLTAPISGVVTQINGAVGDTAAGTANTPFLTVVNTSSLAIHGTIGEADVANLKLGQTAGITVDAVSASKRFTGKVTRIDLVATLQQGVPVYGVDVTLDVTDTDVRAGMSATANIIVASKRDVLVVPNLAIRSIGGRRGVQVMREGEPVEVATVAFGIANDQVTEVTSGLAEGDVVVLPTARAAATPPAGQFRVPGGAGGGVAPGR